MIKGSNDEYNLVSLQRGENLFDPFLGDDHHLESVTDFDMSLDCTGERISNQLLHLHSRQRCDGALLHFMTTTGAALVLILEVDLVIEEGHDQARGRTGGAALFALVAADGIVAVQRTSTVFVQAAKDGVDVVREETLVVQDRRETLGAGFDGHGLAVVVPVHLDDVVQTFLQCLSVGREPDYRQYDMCSRPTRVVPTDPVHLGRISRVDAVSGCRPRVSR